MVKDLTLNPVREVIDMMIELAIPFKLRIRWFVFISAEFLEVRSELPSTKLLNPP